MMLKKKLLFPLAAVVLTLSSCMKEEVYDREGQMATDRQKIETFITEKKLTDVKENNGVFYQVIKPGTGTETVNLNDTVTVNYTGRLLDGTVFETSKEPVRFTLSSVILGWQYGVPMIKQGGQVRLLIPSPLAYAQFAAGTIPANSPLDFTIDLIKVNKYQEKK